MRIVKTLTIVCFSLVLFFGAAVPTRAAQNRTDLIDTGDTPGDEVNYQDYNVLLAGFRTTYDIFDYNELVGRFEE